MPMMSAADLAGSRVLPDCIYKLHAAVDHCGRDDIDFDFFDEQAPSAAAKHSTSETKTTTTVVDVHHVEVHDEENRDDKAHDDEVVHVDVHDDERDVEVALCLPELAEVEDDGGAELVVDLLDQTIEDDGEESAREPNEEEETVIATVTVSATIRDSSEEDQEQASQEVVGGTRRSSDAATKTKAPTSVSGKDEEDYSDDGVDEDAQPDHVHDDNDDDDEEEGGAFGVQELTLTVRGGSGGPRGAGPRRGCKSPSTSSSLTVVSSARTGSSSCRGDSVEDAIEAITQALRGSRPTSSVARRSYAASLPAGPFGSAGRPRRLNMSFSNEEARRIQRDNELLLRRIVTQRGRQPRLGPPAPPPRSAPPPAPPPRCSHAVNRARRSLDIERENQILLKKIQAVKRCPSQLSRSSSSMSGYYSYR